jgi:hypothetical protein
MIQLLARLVKDNARGDFGQLRQPFDCVIPG